MLEDGSFSAGWDRAEVVDKEDVRAGLLPRKSFETYKVVNYSEFGRKVVGWAHAPETRPTTIEEFRDQAGGDIYIPDFVKSVEFAQGNETRLVVYLPPVYKLNDAEKRAEEAVKRSGKAAVYPLPDFYAAIVSGSLTEYDEILLSRIGDYSVAGCH